MSGYIALKQIQFSGKVYEAGEAIPAEAIIPARVPALLRTGFIAEATADIENDVENGQDDAFSVIKVNLPIETEDGVLELSADEKDIVTAFEVLQLKNDDILKAITTIESDAQLIIINALTKNASVKKATKERAAELAESEESGEAE